MSPKIILICSILTSLAFGSLAYGQYAVADNHPGSVKTIARCDKNGDGKLTEKEFIGVAIDEAQRAKKVRSFKKFDTDKDGLVTMAELNARFNTIKK